MIMSPCENEPLCEDRFCESSSPVSVASMMLLTEASLHKAPIMEIKRQATPPSCPPAKKPLKGILKKKNRRRTTKETTSTDKSSSSGNSFRRCVSFTGLCNSRWDADTTHRTARNSAPPCHLGGSLPQHMALNVDDPWSNVPKTAQSPRIPRRPVDAATTEAIPTPRRQAAPMRPPRRVLSHENLFQHKIDFFLEQTANHQKQMEDNMMSKSTPNHHDCKPKDIEELESSLMSMQKFLVALHSVPNNQKLLQKHMDHQTKLQAEIDQQHLRQCQRRREQDEEDDYDDDDSVDSTDDEDEDDDDDDLEDFIQELQKQPLPMMGADLFDMATAGDDEDDEDDDVLCF